MVHTSAMNAVRFPSIATSEAGARGFVQRLVMQTVFDVLERHAHRALLPDAVISAILDQLNVEISYTIELPNGCWPRLFWVFSIKQPFKSAQAKE
ncbi:hypothetical protein KIN20_017375 [Parelaphostrongylus tenuis]|uniref:Uncharacterized protein n=1 Tax=Parelaphostrongylus tenuis TaxID=148309 RepID=A0AAD5QNL5_PARTN|nr:hypothetical protein KIN20_017375 [Parelaphostrongylus tenuis]